MGEIYRNTVNMECNSSSLYSIQNTTHVIEKNESKTKYIRETTNPSQIKTWSLSSQTFSSTTFKNFSSNISQTVNKRNSSFDSFLAELKSEDQDLLKIYSNDPLEKDHLIPNYLLSSTLNEMGFSDSKFEPIVFDIIREIAHDMTLNTLTFAACSAKKANQSGIILKDVVTYLDMAYGIHVLGSRE